MWGIVVIGSLWIWYICMFEGLILYVEIFLKLNDGFIFKVELKFGCFWWNVMGCGVDLVVKVGKIIGLCCVMGFDFFDGIFLLGLGLCVFLCEWSWLVWVNVLL